jgi:hypothetical protein
MSQKGFIGREIRGKKTAALQERRPSLQFIPELPGATPPPAGGFERQRQPAGKEKAALQEEGDRVWKRDQSEEGGNPVEEPIAAREAVPSPPRK